ncbi:hypothetical protein CEXT_307331 [Caerostris extrusa]|uniref:Uncharacterized protein n=1 Tax=Caerostris extrusa TaxID=172846 RepID=A0AAV4UUP8_CAEEX|nr:hypothetical protein CEXT_307331 [Caerostris extrusa]
MREPIISPLSDFYAHYGVSASFDYLPTFVKKKEKIRLQIRGSETVHFGRATYVLIITPAMEPPYCKARVRSIGYTSMNILHTLVRWGIDFLHTRIRHTCINLLHTRISEYPRIFIRLQRS